MAGDEGAPAGDDLGDDAGNAVRFGQCHLRMVEIEQDGCVFRSVGEPGSIGPAWRFGGKGLVERETGVFGQGKSSMQQALFVANVLPLDDRKPLAVQRERLAGRFLPRGDGFQPQEFDLGRFPNEHGGLMPPKIATPLAALKIPPPGERRQRESHDHERQNDDFPQVLHDAFASNCLSEKGAVHFFG